LTLQWEHGSCWASSSLRALYNSAVAILGNPHYARKVFSPNIEHADHQEEQYGHIVNYELEGITKQ